MPGGRGERMSQCLGMVPPPGLKGQPQRPRGPPSGTRPARGLLRARTTWRGPTRLPGLTSTLEEYSLVSWGLAGNWHCLGPVSRLNVVTQPRAPSHPRALEPSRPWSESGLFRTLVIRVNKRPVSFGFSICHEISPILALSHTT